SAPPPRPIVGDEPLQAQLDAVRSDFVGALRAAAQPIATPTAVTEEAARADGPHAGEEDGADSERTRKVEAGRFGSGFGLTVPRALELLVPAHTEKAADAVALAVREHGLAAHHAEAEADVQRALVALRRIGLDDPAVVATTEYPLAMLWNDGKLVSGFI